MSYREKKNVGYAKRMYFDYLDPAGVLKQDALFDYTNFQKLEGCNAS